MSHLIKKHDTVLAKEKCWHGLEKIVEFIGIEQAEQFHMLPPIREVNTTLLLDSTGKPVSFTLPKETEDENASDLFNILEALDIKDLSDLKGYKLVASRNWKAIIADITDRGESETLVPLASHSADYHVIDNRTCFEMILEWVKKIDGLEIATFGTLDNLKKFFVSLQFAGEQGQIRVGPAKRKDHIKMFYNILTGHEGTALYGFESGTRVVCDNTFRWSLSSAQSSGDTVLKVRHTKGAETKIVQFDKTIEAHLKKQAFLGEYLNQLDNQEMTKKEILGVAAYFIGKMTGRQDHKFGLSTQAINRANGITELAFNGRGQVQRNDETTAYAAWNGGTEAQTHHSFKSDNVSNQRRMSYSEFGAGATFKEAWTGLFLPTDENGTRVISRDEIAKYSEQGLKDYYKGIENSRTATALLC